jgi:hypothetical protein
MRRPDDPQSFKLKAMLNGIGNDVESMLPDDALSSYRELVAVGEGKVALENLCSNIGDYEVVLDQAAVGRLQAACEEVGVDPRYWRPLSRGG